MKTTLEHLPTDKQQELQDITDSIVNLVKPEMIILFGSYSRGDWVEDRYKEDDITYEYRSDYDILVVTGKPKEIPLGFCKEVRRRVNKAENRKTPTTMIFHDIAYLNGELEEGQYFFSDIVKEGTLLYNTGNYELATPKKLSSLQRKNISRNYFEKWHKKAAEFLRGYDLIKKSGDLNLAIFILHQAAERYYITIALVFTHYKPKTHDLAELNKIAFACDARFKKVFPKQTEEEKRLFKLLVDAYIDSRYIMDYSVDPKDLEWLGGRVAKLKELTELICSEKIETIGKNE